MDLFITFSSWKRKDKNKKNKNSYKYYIDKLNCKIEKNYFSIYIFLKKVGNNKFYIN